MEIICPILIEGYPTCYPCKGIKPSLYTVDNVYEILLNQLEHTMQHKPQ